MGTVVALTLVVWMCTTTTTNNLNIKSTTQQYPELSHLKIVVTVEANARFDGDYIHRALSRFGMFRGEGVGEIGEVEFLSDNGHKAGINKTKQRTNDYILHTNVHLESGKLRFHNKFNTASAKPGAKAILFDWNKQLKAFKWPDADQHNPRWNNSKGPNAKWNGQNGMLSCACVPLSSLLTVAVAVAVVCR